MRTLTDTLLAAQRAPNRKPVVRVVASNKLAGVVNLVYSRLYTGAEDPGPQSLALSSDGSLIRLRISSPDDNWKLYRQRVTEPGSGADFTAWAYMGQYGVAACALCSLGTEVSLFWVTSAGDITWQESSDNGATWPMTEYPGFAPTGAVKQMAAAYKPNGDIGLFFSDVDTLYLIERIAEEWQSRVSWDKSTGELSGVAAVYDNDFKLLVSGKDAAGDFKIWSLVYGDGGEVPAGNWSDLKEIAAAPADAGYEFNNLFLDKPDVYCSFFTEKFSGDQAYDRPFWSHTLPGTGFLESRWKEPESFETESAFGMMSLGIRRWIGAGCLSAVRGSGDGWSPLASRARGPNGAEVRQPNDRVIVGTTSSDSFPGCRPVVHGPLPIYFVACHSC